MKKLLLPALAVGALSSTAMAEPLTLTEADMDAVTAGQVNTFDFKDIEGFVSEFFSKEVFIDVNKFVDIDKNVFVEAFANIDGNLADAEALAEAFGDDTFSETQAVTVTTDFTSTSYSEALSATDNFDDNNP